MNSSILQIAQRYVRILLLVFAFVALARGHNYPGGGFIAGLLAGLSLVMKGFAYDIEVVARQMRVAPGAFIAFGLMLILGSALFSLLSDEAFMKGLWLILELPFVGDLKLGTPLLFDIGVFLAVIGITRMFFFSIKSTE